jgi:hypothetical protein
LFSGDLVCVHQESEPYVEHHFVWSELVTLATANSELRYAPMPMFVPKVRSLYRRGYHRFLTPTVLPYGKREYRFPSGRSELGAAYLDAKERAVAIRYCEQSSIARRESIYIRRDILSDLLTKFHCRLLTFLWCFRYSERPLQSWRITERTCRQYSRREFNYEIEFTSYRDDRRRPLSASCSCTRGKRDFTDAI